MDQAYRYIFIDISVSVKLIWAHSPSQKNCPEVHPGQFKAWILEVAGILEIIFFR
jgi:hypothetical protein